MDRHRGENYDYNHVERQGQSHVWGVRDRIAPKGVAEG
jgi:hypothetical protein